MNTDQDRSKHAIAVTVGASTYTLRSEGKSLWLVTGPTVSPPYRFRSFGEAADAFDDHVARAIEAAKARVSVRMTTQETPK